MAISFEKLIFVLIFAILSSMTAWSQTEHDIIGKWKGEDKPDMQSEFYLAKDGLYYGKIIKDTENKGTLGRIILKKFKYNVKTNSFKGTMSPPDRDMELDATITFESNDKLKIVAKKFIISKTIYFIRIK
jgi:hypothetical protein